ncbi:hypothetical protein RGQ29_031264 [Quercus rubra]|uniref:Polygalacturonase n=1 Tax=Quercus rubra TaxID=3512 RepID=A0AAN7EKS3_QUERU|nr:hypothetical protein RGQ29_031264 [Quercus rubra]
MFLNETQALIFNVLIYLTCKHEQNIRFDYVTNSKVQDITSKDNKYFHINLLGCKQLQFQHVTIIASTDSPNTDGIHVGRSSQITITNADIGTDITVNQVTCGPGHGISVGSLGKYQSEEPVSGIRVTGATLSNTDNGVRIKTWPGSSSGVASDIHFEDSPSKVKISNVSFKKIRGTSSTKEAKIKNNKMGKNLSIATISLLLVLASTKAQQVFDVKSYGAQPNADITQALTKAWKAACAVAGSKVVISTGVYKLGLVTLLGPCKGAIEFNLQGTYRPPSDVASFMVKMVWVAFERIDGLTVSGGGDSKYFHINLLGCKQLQFQHVTIIAPADSPNTDGIHGDDCISFGDGTQDIIVNQVTCGPGHGISVGSLGKYQSEEPVSGIKVTGATFSNTDNGVRIKTWPGSSSGVAFDIHFEDVVMNNVANPIIIDQNYCPNSQCLNQVIINITNIYHKFDVKKIVKTSNIEFLGVPFLFGLQSPSKVKISNVRLQEN